MNDIKNTPLQVVAKKNAPLDPRKQKLIGYLYLIFTLITVSIFGIFALLPAFSTITNLQKQFEDNKKVSEALKTKLSALASLDGQYQTLEQDLPVLYNAIPNSPEIATFIRQLETIAQQTRVTITALSIGSVEYFPLKKTGSELYSYTFSLEISGEEQEINAFINDMISLQRIVSVDRITTGQAQAGEFKSSIGGKVYFSKDSDDVEQI